MTIGTSLGVLAVVAVVSVGYIVLGRRWRLAAAVFGAFVCSTLAVGILRDVIDRARPPYDLALVHVAGASMPSTHAARTAAVAAAIMFAFDWPTPRARATAAAYLSAGVLPLASSRA